MEPVSIPWMTGDELAHELRARRLSQVAWAHETGHPYRTVANWIYGVSPVPRKVAALFLPAARVDEIACRRHAAGLPTEDPAEPVPERDERWPGAADFKRDRLGAALERAGVRYDRR